MKKKLYITRAIKIICFALAVVISTYLLQAYVLKRNDNNTLRMDGFFVEDKESLDVVYIGASDVYAGYSAGLAYDEYGLTSYPFATQASPPQVVLPQIKDVIKHQNPKMIVVEINSFMYKDNDLPAEASHRMFVDNIPRDDIWADYIKENFPEEDQIEYWLPIIKYHGSWSDYPWKLKFLLTDLALRQRGYSSFRGFKTVANEFHPGGKLYNDTLAETDDKLPLGYTSERCLRETLDYLKENNIKNVIFTRFPHIVNNKAYSRFKRCNTAQQIIEESGFDFINLERYGKQIGIDVNKDFYNWDHLNIYGAEKLTRYFCDKLTKEYGVTPNELTESQKAEWAESVKTYKMIYYYSAEMIKRRSDLGKNDNSGTTVSEDDTSVKTIEKYARKTHPELFADEATEAAKAE